MAEIKLFDAGEIFSGKKSGTLIAGYKTPSKYVPPVDIDYVWSEWVRDVLVWLCMDKFQPLYVFGPSGTGKSSCLRQVCARINMPVFSVTGSERLEVSDLLGHYVLKNQTTQWLDGPLVQAMKEGALFVIEEIDVCSSSILMALNTILDGSDLVIAEHGGELVKRHPQFRIAVTGNSSGNGDDTGHYVGISQMNLAFCDRFLCLEAQYPSAESETALLTRKFPQLPKDVCTGMVCTANMIRKLFQQEDPSQQPCELTVTTRGLLRWADLTLRYEPLASMGISPVLYAADLAFANRASKPTKTMIHELIQRVFSETTKKEK